MSGATLASLNAAVKRFGKITALDQLTLSVGKGEILALLGHNGAGKSTAINILLGLQRPDSGHAELFGLDPQEIAARRRIGIMMQEVGLSPALKPRELIRQVSNYYHSPYDTEAVIKRLSLESLAERRYGVLSGGQKRQVQFGMAICGRPELLFLDEPSVGMDVHARSSLWEVIRDLRREGCSIVLTTHNLEEAEALADRVTVIAHGKLVASGTVDQIRSYVSRKTIFCKSTLPADTIRAWPGVEQLHEEFGRLQIVTHDAESILRQLLNGDAQVRDIEVRRAGLTEAFVEITNANQAANGNGGGQEKAR
jgi:ABC-2 type transport system ATP-binding protein